MQDNNKIKLKDVGWEGVGWIHLAYYIDQWQAVMNIVMNHLGCIKWWEFLDYTNSY
jgi:hypothetical protein